MAGRRAGLGLSTGDNGFQEYFFLILDIVL
jgi:hypothetical protein